MFNFNKTIRYVMLLLVIIIMLTSCSSKMEKSEKSDEYITFTYSRYMNDGTNSSILNEIWYYDSLTKESNKIFELDYTSQYPLGFYDKENNLIYYTKNVVNNNDAYNGDQIFVTDLNTQIEKQLTSNLFAVNYIIPADQYIYFVALPKGANVLRLGSIDKETGEIKYWGNEETIDDINIEAIAVSNKNKKVYVSAYSDAERRYNVLHQDGPSGQNNFKMPLHTVYEIDLLFDDYRQLFSENEWIRTLMINENDVVALSDKQYNEAEVPSTLIVYNLKENSISKSLWETYRLQIGDANFSSDGKLIYSIVDINQKRGLYEYSIEQNNFTEIFLQADGFINNIQVVKD